MNICEYGCGKEASFQLKSGKWCCSESHYKCEGYKRKLHIALLKSYDSGKLNYRIAKIEKYIDICFDDIIDLFWKRKRVIHDQQGKCFECGLDKWRDHLINLEIHHIDGNNGNWKRDNVIALCPNCHSITETFSGRNINSGKIKVDDSILKKALEQNKSIRSALIQCGLAPKGGNYERAKKLKFK